MGAMIHPVDEVDHFLQPRNDGSAPLAAPTERLDRFSLAETDEPSETKVRG